MNRSRWLVVAVGLVLACSLTAGAFAQQGGGQGGQGRRGGGGFGGGQGGPGGFGGFGGMGMSIDKPVLLNSTQVREELKVTEEQGKKLDEILASHQEASREIRSGLRGRDLSDEEREKARQEAEKKNAELLAKTEVKIAEALEKKQAKRLDEIALQQQGVDGLVASNVIAAIKLSDEQVKKIKGLFTTRDEELAKLRPTFGRGGPGRGPGGGPGGGQGGGAPNFEEIREKSEKVRTDAEKAAFAVLSSEQNESFTKLKGEPFELDRRSLFRGGQGGPGGRQGGFGGPGGRGGPGGGPGGGRQGGGERKRPPADEDA